MEKVFTFKSKPLGCLAYPNIKLYVSNGKNDLEIELDKEKELNKLCPHCHKPWREHIK